MSHRPLPNSSQPTAVGDCAFRFNDATRCEVAEPFHGPNGLDHKYVPPCGFVYTGAERCNQRPEDHRPARLRWPVSEKRLRPIMSHLYTLPEDGGEAVN